MNDNITYEVEKWIKTEMPDGFKMLIYLMRKKKLKFSKIATTLKGLLLRDVAPSTVRTIFLTISNRFLKSSADCFGHLHFKVFKHMADKIIYQIMEATKKDYDIAFLTQWLPPSSPKYLNSIKYFVKISGKKVSFKFELIIGRDGKLFMDIIDYKHSYTVSFSDPIELMTQLAMIEKTLYELLTDG